MTDGERLALDRAAWHAARTAHYLRELHATKRAQEPVSPALMALEDAAHDAARSYHELIAAGAKPPLRGAPCPEEKSFA